MDNGRWRRGLQYNEEDSQSMYYGIREGLSRTVRFPRGMKNTGTWRRPLYRAGPYSVELLLRTIRAGKTEPNQAFDNNVNDDDDKLQIPAPNNRTA